MPRREVADHLFAKGTNCTLTEERDATRTLEKIEDPRSWGARALDLLHFEFLRPGDHGTPYELIDEHNYGNHGKNAEENRASVTVIGSGLQIRAESRQAEVAKLLASHQKEPGSRDRHHGIPDEADGGEGQLDLKEALPPVETVDGGRFTHLARNAFQRGVKAEGHVPDLPGKNKQDRAQLNAQLTSRKKSGHGQHHTRKEAQYWNGLQHVKQRNHETFGARTVSGDVSVGDGEEQAQHIGQRDAQQRVSSIDRQVTEAAA